MSTVKNKILRVIKNPYVFLAKLVNGRAHFLSDKRYINIMYRAAFDKKIDWVNPKTYNEKLQWLKLYDRRPEYTIMVDKYAAKEYVSKIIGSQYIIPTLGIWDRFGDIDFDSLPDQFVLKCTHDSGGLVIVKDKSDFDMTGARKKLETCLKRNYFWKGREWPYKNVRPRIIAEKYMVDESNSELKDYKFFCFSGNVKYLFVASDRNIPGREVKFDYFDIHFNRLPMRQSVHPTSEYKIDRPETFDEMIQVAERLAKNIPQVRIDLYEINGSVYFGEYTFFHHGGFVPFIPDRYDYEWGALIELPR